MFKNILKISFRNLSGNASHSLINVLGLSIGITSALIIASIIRFDLSFDNYHEFKDRTYRLVTDDVTKERRPDSGTPYPLRLVFQDDFPEVEHLTMVDNNMLSGLVSVTTDAGETIYEEDANNQAFVMPDFFKMFRRDFLVGDSEKVFENGNSVALSKTLAEKYFGDHISAVGQVIKIENLLELTVTGVINDAPMNTDLPFNMLISFDAGGEERIWKSWDSSSSSVQCYFTLRENADVDEFGDKIIDYIHKHMPEGHPAIEKSYAQPLSDIHHNPDYSNYNWRVATQEEILTLFIVGLLLILAASINFINLNTAQAIKRSKEIGVRKVLGSGRGYLVVQFLSEAALITFASILISLGVMEVALIAIEDIIGYPLPSTSYDGLLFLILSGLFVSVTILAGLYPAVVVSGYQPIEALKNKISSSYKNGFSLRKSLIIIQLLISQVLVVCVIVVSLQIDHFMKTPIGVDTEAVVEFRIPTPEDVDLVAFQNLLKQQAGISNITFSNTGTSSDNTWGGQARFSNEDEVINERVHVKLIDEHYLDTYGLELAAGRNVVMDTTPRFIINETAMKAFGINDPEQILGTTMNVWGNDGTIIGVIKDFHTESLHEPVYSTALWVRTNGYYLGAAKLVGSDWARTINTIQKEWEKIFPGYIFSYTFLDDSISRFYEGERRMAKTFTIFALIAIFIGGMGLFGLISYLASTRRKEIGVRKALGARVDQIVGLLSFDFAKLVLLSFIIAAPLSWYYMNEWLARFANRIEINGWIFLLALTCSLTVTLLTVGYRSLRAASVNPVNSLKDE
ncbi:MAG: ABC transporter permease [Bacteroidota bacterium]